jgi:hypothetical protein
VTLVLPIASLVVAVVASVSAILALRQVAAQLKIANEQTRLSQAQLLLQRNDFDATIAGLRIAQDQAKKADEERAKVPILRLLVGGHRVDDEEGPRIEVSSRKTDDKYHFQLSLSIENDGPRAASAVYATFICGDTVRPDTSRPPDPKAIPLANNGFAVAGDVRNIAQFGNVDIGHVDAVIESPNVFALLWSIYCSEAQPNHGELFISVLPPNASRNPT